MEKVNLVIFHSEGEPYDKGLNITEAKNIIKEIAKEHVDNIIIYTPRILRKMNYNYYVSENKNKGCYRNPGGKDVGFLAWKPLICLLELEKMNDGDILVYRDCNCIKYPILKEYENFRENVKMFLNHCNFDFFISREDNKMKLRNFCKTSVIRELGENHPFVYEFPLLFGGLILIFKKTDISLKFLQEWLKACENKDWINGQVHGKLDRKFKWHTAEQAILGVIIANWVRKRKYDIPVNYPNLMFSYRNLNKQVIPTNYKYLELLDK